MNDMDEYRQLSTVDQAYVSAYGWDAYHRKKFLEREFQKRNIPQSTPQTQEEEPQEEETDTEETQIQEDLDVQEEEHEIRQKKLEILDAMLDKLNREEAQEKDDNELRAKQLELLEKQLNLSTFWNSVLATKWEPLLRDIIFSVQAQMKGSIAKLTFTFENDGKTMYTSKRFYGKNGKEVLHELTHEIYGEDEND